MKYLLDTDICISFLKDRHQVPQKIEEVGMENCYVSEITIIELTYGAYNSQRFEKHKLEVTKIESLYEVVPLYAAIDLFSKEKVRLKKAGDLIPDFDLLIGCTSVSNNMVMVSNNVKHLARIKGIQLENWRDPKFNQFLK